MDKAHERETHDFMNVESFSQLPFIRPAPAIKEKGGIRLFGIEFGCDGAATNESESAETTTNNNAFELDSTKDNTTTTENGESSRRFECHYCCRNFPTSQALGGHQNAHKRERQHAKRAHLQSTMVHGGGFSDAQVCGLMNYRFRTSAPSMAMANYATWNNSNYSSTAIASSSSSGRFYYGSHGHGGHGTSYSHHHQPINGSPLGLWRIPAQSGNPGFNQDRSLHPLPLFAGEEMNVVRASQVGASAGSQNRYVYDSKHGVHDHVSLDLHL